MAAVSAVNASPDCAGRRPVTSSNATHASENTSAAAVAWHTGKDPLTSKPLYVPRDPKEGKLQRALLQLHEYGNYIYAERHLQKMGRGDLLRRLKALKPLLRPDAARASP